MVVAVSDAPGLELEVQQVVEVLFLAPGIEDRSNFELIGPSHLRRTLLSPIGAGLGGGSPPSAAAASTAAATAATPVMVDEVVLLSSSAVIRRLAGRAVGLVVVVMMALLLPSTGGCRRLARLASSAGRNI